MDFLWGLFAGALVGFALCVVLLAYMLMEDIAGSGDE